MQGKGFYIIIQHGLVEAFERGVEIRGAEINDGFLFVFTHDRTGQRGRVLSIDVLTEVAAR